MTFAQRISGVLRLDADTFEGIEADRGANGQALAVVVAASLAAGLGAGLLLGPLALARATLGALVGWVMWAGVTYVIGTRLLPERDTQTDLGELLRVIGFSYAPNLFAFFAFLPGFAGFLVRVVVAIWLLAATVVAVRQALDYRSTWRAFVVVMIGWVFFIILQDVL